jgi:integral membrane protein (TIGR01906 family)
MPSVTSLPASAGAFTAAPVGVRSRLLHRLLLPAGTALAILSASLLLLLTPLFMHAALDLAGSASLLGMSAADTRAVSDRTVAELLFGPGTFAFDGSDGVRFYGAAEAGHMQDVRVVLYGFLALGVGGFGGVLVALARTRADAPTLRAVGRGGGALAVGLLTVGVFAVVAFNVAFELFHRILFPGGNWSFDPASQRLVQLYPLAFWQISAAALAILGIGGGAAVWLLARRRADRIGGPS